MIRISRLFAACCFGTGRPPACVRHSFASVLHMEDVWEIAGRRELQVRCRVQVDAEVMEMPHMASKRLARTILCLVLAILTGACSSLRHGGAPDPMYSVSSDLESLKAQFKEAASIDAFYSGDKSAESRTDFSTAELRLPTWHTSNLSANSHPTSNCWIPPRTC